MYVVVFSRLQYVKYASRVSFDFETGILDLGKVVDICGDDLFSSGALAVQLADFVRPHDGLIGTDLVPIFLDHRAGRVVVVAEWAADNRAYRRV